MFWSENLKEKEFGIYNQRVENNIKINHKEISCSRADQTHMAEERISV
jgi:hypothetical protein